MIVRLRNSTLTMVHTLGHLLNDARFTVASDSEHDIKLPGNEFVTKAYEQLRDTLYRHALLITRNASHSEELVQDAFLKLHRNVAAHRTVDNVRAWLFRVIHNAAIDLGRTTHANASLSETANARSVEDQCIGRVPSPEWIALLRERRALLAAAVERLPAVQRHCLYLRKEGLSYREISIVLSIGQTTVVDHLTRAVTRLHREIHDR